MALDTSSSVTQTRTASHLRFLRQSGYFTFINLAPSLSFLGVCSIKQTTRPRVRRLGHLQRLGRDAGAQLFDPLAPATIDIGSGASLRGSAWDDSRQHFVFANFNLFHRDGLVFARIWAGLQELGACSYACSRRWCTDACVALDGSAHAPVLRKGTQGSI